MEPAVSKKYCKTDIGLSCRHTKGLALSSAILSSRHYLHLLATGPAGVEGRFVKEIMLSLDGISVGGTKHNSLQMLSQHKIWQHSGNVFTSKGCGKKFNPNNSINRHNKLVCGKPHHRKTFCHFSERGKNHNCEDHPQYERVRGGGEEGRLWPAPRRGKTSSTLLNGNLLCWFLINWFV